jgi:hypothetical protein
MAVAIRIARINARFLALFTVPPLAFFATDVTTINWRIS